MATKEFHLSERDERLLDIYKYLVPYIFYGTTGLTWYITSTEGCVEFKTYKSFIKWVEDEVKESLLTYVLNGEVDELVGLWN